MTTIHDPTGVDYVGITTSTNLAYGKFKQGGGSKGDHEYEVVSASHQSPPPVSAEKGGYEVPLPPPPQSHVPAMPLSAQHQGSDGGGESGEAVYEHICGDQ